MVIKTSNPMIKIFTSSSNHQTESMKQSPKSPKPFDLGGVGLGIVAALESSGDDQRRISAIFSRNLSRSKQAPINPSKVPQETATDDNSREYTRVNKGAELGRTKKLRDGSDFRPKMKRASVFHISPADDVDYAGDFPATDFLGCCNMCRKKLHGRDIYMYRGEKAFCSTECRYNQIKIDERKEKYYSKEALLSSSSPCVNGQKQIYATGILAS